jgi:pyoverdine/dityrosine biosynthesis protein Dit1/AcrR family transcriptional regulator
MIDTFRTSMTIEHRTRQRLIEAAVKILSETEFRDDLIDRMAAMSGYGRERVLRFFRNSDDVIIALYNRFASDLESRITDLPEAPLADRFRAMMSIKRETMLPFREALKKLSPKFLDRQDVVGVLSSETEAIRTRVRGVIGAVIEGATDHDGQSTTDLSNALYSAYLAIMWLWLRDEDGSETLANGVARAISFSSPYLDNAALRLPLKMFGVLQRTVVVEDRVAHEKAVEILKALFAHRRLLADSGACEELPCKTCHAIHVPKTAYFISTGQPIHMLLPAFPAKSPNPKKTIGKLPDMAEHQALLYLGDICRKLSKFHGPGVRLTICSDGHVFSDLVGVLDDDVTAYGAELARMISSLDLEDVIDTFALTDLYENVNFDTMRLNLAQHYSQTIEVLRTRAASNEQVRSTVDGIQRFLFEDRSALEPERSRTQIRNECRELAYQVVQRSDGWGRLLADCFPMALRLSIHPQSPHSEKIGILLGDADDVWLTPWHSVAVKTGDRFKMMKRAEAEALGARLVDSAMPYYEL